MRTIQLLFAVLLSLSCFAQDLTVIDTVKLKCSYEYKYLADTTATTNKKYYSDILHLQIGSKSSKCFSYRTYQHDSIDAYGNLRETYNQIFREVKSKGWNKKELVKRLPHKGMTTYVYKNYPDGKMTAFDNIMTDYFRYEDEMNPQDWDMSSDSTKTIMGYECQMATCKFRGREWTAWFALDIPINDGPWKFCGLPGLIMEAYDRGKQYCFCINGLQQVAAEPLYFGIDGKDVSKFQKVKRTELLKIQLDFFRDPSSYISAATGGMALGFSLGNFEKKRDLLERE